MNVRVIETTQTSLIFWAAVRLGPLQDLRVAVLGGPGAGELVPETVVVAGPFQDVEVAVLGGVGAGRLVPGAAVRTQPL